ncbi:MAG: hypothetical protein Ct9H90mP7_2550 [Candidatus Neomarinimicrobiota bacterium]|nr:MAG: hypothetical protein Ct9H90mP7_2550 [Candidatus Neomarinimicrobiota bacterium]
MLNSMNSYSIFSKVVPLDMSTTWSISAFISGQPSTSILLNRIPKTAGAGLNVIFDSTPV